MTDQIPQQQALPARIKTEQCFGTTFYYVTTKSKKGEPGPQDCMLKNMHAQGHVLAVSYEKHKGDSWYGSYPDIDTFLKSTKDVAPKQRMFYEILSGATHTFADLDWKLETMDEEQPIVKSFESFLRSQFERCLGAVAPITFVWSTASSAPEKKGSLHVVVRVLGYCWENNDAQKQFWISALASLSESKEFPALFRNGEPIIDKSVYTKNRAMRCFGSHKHDSTRTLRAFLPEARLDQDYFATVERAEGLTRFELLPNFRKALRIVKKRGGVTVKPLTVQVQNTEALCWTEEFLTKLVREKVPNAEFHGFKEDGGVAYLKTTGERTCILSGESNLTDNCYLTYNDRGIYFHCHDAGCNGKSVAIHRFGGGKGEGDGEGGGDEGGGDGEPDNDAGVVGAAAFDADVYRNDLGLSEIFVRLRGGDIRATSPSGDCFIWSNATRLWEDKGRQDIVLMISSCLEAHVSSQMSGAGAKKLKKVLAYVQSTHGASSVCNMALPRVMSRKFVELVNTNPDLLPIRDGLVVDLRTGQTRERTREDMFSFERPVRLCHVAEALRKVDEFMLRIANGDAQLKRCLQKNLGYCLTGHMHERVFLLWWGKGSNGKSTVCELMKLILGNFYGVAPKSVFVGSTAKNGAGAGAASPHLVPLIGVRMAVLAETAEAEKLNVELLKSVSGSDTISYRPLYGAQSTFTPVCKLIMQTNHKPNFDCQDTAVMDRFRMIPFLARFVKEKPGPGEFKSDPELVKSLRTDLLDAFFTWVLEGAVMWYAEGLGEAPDVARAETSAYMAELDDVSRFIEDCCETGQGYEAKASDLYNRYKRWAEENGIVVRSLTAFGTRLKELHTQDKKRTGNVYQGIRLPAVAFQI